VNNLPGHIAQHLLAKFLPHVKWISFLNAGMKKNFGPDIAVFSSPAALDAAAAGKRLRGQSVDRKSISRNDTGTIPIL
jgi:hypothetical protein